MIYSQEIPGALGGSQFYLAANSSRISPLLLRETRLLDRARARARSLFTVVKL
jgi:hypothetical protein